jgi:hypothetical protein
MDLYDHIQELRAELRNCVDRQERIETYMELARALAEQARRELEIDEIFDTAPR